MDEDFIKTFGPCVVILHGPSMEKHYGPFESGKQAIEWMNHQVIVGNVRNFSVDRLRTPYVERAYDDWWAGDWHQINIVDQEYPKDSWIKTKRRVWRRWRRQADKVLEQLV